LELASLFGGDNVRQVCNKFGIELVNNYINRVPC